MFLLCVGIGVFVACTQEDILTSSNDDVVSFSIGVSQADFTLEDFTRATENGFSTVFSDSDAIGVFAVRNGAVVDGIENHKFMLVEGEWENQGDNIEYLASEFSRMTFWAYYPYDENVTFDPTAENPFATYISNWELGTDQQGENYTQYDLMTSTGEVEGNRLKGQVYFTMHHAMGLAVVEFPDIIYTFNNADMPDIEVKASAGEFYMGGDTLKPYVDSESSTYRFLVKPDETFSVDGTYSGVYDMKYSINSSVSGGVAKLFQMNDPEGTVNLTLEVGDYICKGGLIRKASETPADAIAVVYYVGNPRISYTDPDFVTTNYPKADGPEELVYADLDILAHDYPNAVHGLAMAVHDVVGAYEIDGGMGTNLSSNGSSTVLYSTLVTDNWNDYYYTHVCANTDNRADPTPDSLWPGRLGYNNTKLLMDYIDLYNGKNGCDAAHDILLQWREDEPLPSSYTPWYIPCWVEWQDYIAVAGTCGSSIAAVGGDSFDPSTTHYWTSNERNNQYQWVSLPDATWDLRDRGSGAQMLRLGFAF